MEKDRLVKRQRREKPFTMIDNSLLRDTSLSFSARGILAMCLSYPDDFIIYKSYIQKQGDEGRDKFNKHWKELQAHGYLTKEYVKDEKGRFVDLVWVLHEVPIEVISEPEKEIEKSEEVQSPDKKSEMSEENFESAIDTFKSTFNHQQELTKAQKLQLESLIERFGNDLVLLALLRTLSLKGDYFEDVLTYITSMLWKWKNNGYQSVAEVEEREPFINAKTNQKVKDFIIPVEGPWSERLA